MHGRGRKTIDPRITTTPGHRTSGFHWPGTHCLLAPSANSREVTGGSHEGRACTLLGTARDADVLWMTASNSFINLSAGVATSTDSNGYSTQLPTTGDQPRGGAQMSRDL